MKITIWYAVCCFTNLIVLTRTLDQLKRNKSQFTWLTAIYISSEQRHGRIAQVEDVSFIYFYFFHCFFRVKVRSNTRFYLLARIVYESRQNSHLCFETISFSLRLDREFQFKTNTKIARFYSCKCCTEFSVVVVVSESSGFIQSVKAFH